MNKNKQNSVIVPSFIPLPKSLSNSTLLVDMWGIDSSCFSKFQALLASKLWETADGNWLAVFNEFEICFPLPVKLL